MRISDWSSDVCSSDLLCESRLASALSKNAGRRDRGTGDRRLCLCLDAVGGLFPVGGAVRHRARLHVPGDAGAAQHRREQRAPASADRRRARLCGAEQARPRSEEHTSELQSLMRISYAVFCLKTKKDKTKTPHTKSMQHYDTN